MFSTVLGQTEDLHISIEISTTERYLLQDVPKRMCRKQNGNGWRCQNPALPHQTLCMKHYSAFASSAPSPKAFHSVRKGATPKSAPVETNGNESFQENTEPSKDGQSFVMSEGEDTPWWTFGSKYCECHFLIQRATVALARHRHPRPVVGRWNDHACVLAHKFSYFNGFFPRLNAFFSRPHFLHL